jgi:hypothetical protein
VGRLGDPQSPQIHCVLGRLHGGSEGNGGALRHLCCRPLYCPPLPAPKQN